MISKNRILRNFWMLEIGIFCLIYGIIVEITDSTPFILPVRPGEEWLFTNTSALLFIAGVVAVLTSFRSQISFRLYIVSLGLVSAAGMVRAISVIFGYNEAQPWLVFLSWAQISLLQARLWADSLTGNYHHHSHKDIR